MQKNCIKCDICLYKHRNECDLLFMAKMNGEKFREWVLKAGHKNAKDALMEQVGYSESAAEKMVAGSYPSRPFRLQRQALSKLTGIPESELFPLSESEGDPPDNAA